MKISILITTILISGCSTFGGPDMPKNILKCTIEISKETNAHVVDSANICMKAYKFEKSPRTELDNPTVDKQDNGITVNE